MDAPMPTRLSILVVFLLLAGLLLAAGAAHGAGTGSAASSLSLEEPFETETETEEEWEGEEDEGACEAAEEEVEEGELTQAEADEICKEEAEERKKKKTSPGGAAPEECILRSAHAQASLIAHESKLKLTVGYTTYEPIVAKLQIGHLATVHRHLGRSGVLRFVENLPGDNAPKQLAVQIEPPGKSAGCPFRRLVLFPR
jgi:hypothetical protein